MDDCATPEQGNKAHADGHGDPSDGRTPSGRQVRRPRDVEAPALTTPEEFQTSAVLGISFAHFFNDTYTSFLAPLLPALINKLALSKTEAGLLAFLQSSPSLLQPVIGHLSDRLNLRYLVVLAPAFASTMMSLLGVAPHYGMLVLLVMMAGLSSSSLHAVAPAIAGRLSGASLGRGIGLWMVGGTLGFTVGPLIVVSTVKLLTLEGTPWLMVGGWLASAILFVRLRHVSAPPPTVDEAGSWHATLQALRPVLAPLIGLTVMRGLMFAATFIFLPTFLTEQGANLWFAGLSLSVVAGAGIIGSLLGGSLSDRWGRRLILFIFVLLAPLLMFALLTFGGWAQLPVLIGLGIAMPPAQVIMMAIVQENCPNSRALANGIYLSLAFLSESAGAVVVGALGDLFGLRLAYVTSAVFLLLSLPLVFWLPAGAQSTEDLRPQM